MVRIGQSEANYKPIKLIGAGAEGKAMLMESKKDGGKYVIAKCLKRNEEELQKMEKESIKAQLKFAHPNVLPIFDVCEDITQENVKERGLMTV